jgi:hypothetical protein
MTPHEALTASAIGSLEPVYLDTIRYNGYHYEHTHPFHTGQYGYPRHIGFRRPRYPFLKRLYILFIPLKPVHRLMYLKPQYRIRWQGPYLFPASLPEYFFPRKPVQLFFQKRMYALLKPGVPFLVQPVREKQSSKVLYLPGRRRYRAYRPLFEHHPRFQYPAWLLRVDIVSIIPLSTSIRTCPQ